MKKERKINLFLIVISLVLLAASVFLGIKLKETKKEPAVTNRTIETKLESIGELAGVKLTYRGLITYKDGSVPYISEKGFSMAYTAVIKAGIDLKGTDIKVTGDRIILSIPKAKVVSVEVDPDSLTFYDKKHAVFNWQKPEDAGKAVSAAKKDAVKNAVDEGLLNDAEKSTEKLIKEFLKGLKTKDGKDYIVEVNVKS